MIWYGSVHNRLEENKQFCDEIKIGTGVTEYLYSDRHPYEVIDVVDQKHVYIRELDHKLIGEPYSNDWELISNENNTVYYLTKRGKYWYKTITVTDDILEPEISVETMLFLTHNGINEDDLRNRKKITRYHRINVSFGHAEYYYDYSF
jgi:hypothetical protein